MRSAIFCVVPGAGRPVSEQRPPFALDVLVQEANFVLQLRDHPLIAAPQLLKARCQTVARILQAVANFA